MTIMVVNIRLKKSMLLIYHTLVMIALSLFLSLSSFLPFPSIELPTPLCRPEAKLPAGPNPDRYFYRVIPNAAHSLLPK